jgi:uncharacterized iron-regulated membrane protein
VAAGAVTLNPDLLLAIAEQAAPGARATFFQFVGNSVRIAMKYPEDRTPAGRTNIFIDTSSGKVVYHLNSRTGPFIWWNRRRQSVERL